jgi:BolA family transcriptional regulator, general stress-responsive regulator
MEGGVAVRHGLADIGVGRGRQASARPVMPRMSAREPVSTSLENALETLPGSETVMTVRATIEGKLQAAFSPARLDVIDESEHHRGHGGWREGGETHFRVKLVSEAFAGRSRVDRHRMVNQVLDAELKGRVHALAIEAKAPGE